MEYGAIAALLVGALFGILLASRHFRRMRLPAWAAVCHGLAGATGFGLLLVTVIGNPEFTVARRALLILVVAVFMGCVNVVFHIRGIRHRTTLIVGHALLAVSGVTTLAFALATRPPAVAERVALVTNDASDPSHAPSVPASRLAPGASDTKTSATAPSAPPPTLVGLAAIRGEWAEADLHVDFELGGARIGRESSAIIDRIAARLTEEPRIRRVEVQGHTDERGEDSDNVALARSRARAVIRALAARGIEPTRLVAAGYGARCPSDPACALATASSSCHEEHAWARDRRVVFSVLALGDEAFGGEFVCPRGAELVPSRDRRFTRPAPAR